MIKLVIFDLDGVLVDIKDIHYTTLNDALSAIDSKYCISYDDHIKIFDGLKTYDKLKILSKMRGLPIELYDTIWNHKQNRTIQYLKTLPKQNNIIELLMYLKNNGFIVCVGSNSIRNTIKTVLLSTGYMEYIDFFMSNEDVKYSKPNPEMYLKLMIKANVAPKETLIIEDSPNGMRAAQLSGAKVYRVDSSSDIDTKIIDYIKDINSKEPYIVTKWIDKKLNIVIPMAGAGNRFKEAGYDAPKPLIDVNHKTMIQTVVDNLNIEANYTYIVRSEHYDKYNLEYILNMYTPNCNIIQVKDLTEGAACTVLLAKSLINNDNPLLLANSDQFVEWNSNDFMYKMQNRDCDGGLLTFNDDNPKWSFVKVDENNYITEVAEKHPISNIATVGIYYWKRGSDFVKYAEQMIQKNIRVNNEFYICPVFNQAIEDNKKFQIYNIDKMWGLGTPQDLEYFLNNFTINTQD